MEMSNFYQICIYITLSLMVFSLCVNVVVGFEIFGSVGEMGMSSGNTTNETMANFTISPDYPSGMTMGAIWGIVLSGSTIAGVFLAWVTQDASILGVFIFSGVFWSSFINVMVIITALNVVPLLLLGLFTLPIIFVFVGAVIGMLSGV
jgi:hypothetical protein